MAAPGRLLPERRAGCQKRAGRLLLARTRDPDGGVPTGRQPEQDSGRDEGPAPAFRCPLSAARPVSVAGGPSGHVPVRGRLRGDPDGPCKRCRAVPRLTPTASSPWPLALYSSTCIPSSTTRSDGILKNAVARMALRDMQHEQLLAPDGHAGAARGEQRLAAEEERGRRPGRSSRPCAAQPRRAPRARPAPP